MHEATAGRLRDVDRLTTLALKSVARRKLKSVDRDVVRAFLADHQQYAQLMTVFAVAIVVMPLRNGHHPEYLLVRLATVPNITPVWSATRPLNRLLLDELLLKLLGKAKVGVQLLAQPNGRSRS